MKSEFFEALSSAEKDARDYKTRFEELKKELSERGSFFWVPFFVFLKFGSQLCVLVL